MQNKQLEKIHNKLIRDRIPEILERQGIHCHTLILNKDNYLSALKKKLIEEVYEYLGAGEGNEIEELADILEVIQAILSNNKISFADLESIRLKKLEERGGFSQRLFLEKTTVEKKQDTHSATCLFCQFPEMDKGQLVAQFKHCYAIKDRFPVSPGHTLIIPYAHTENWFTASDEIKEDIIKALDYLKSQLDHEYKPQGYNIGANCGPVAGQTIMHLHMHLIPRYNGDMEDPKGGVRGVIPSKQKY